MKTHRSTFVDAGRARRPMARSLVSGAHVGGVIAAAILAAAPTLAQSASEAPGSPAASVRHNLEQPVIKIEPTAPQVTVEPVQQEPRVTIETLDRREADLRDAGVDRNGIVGLDAVGANDESVGSVRDLLLDRPDGRIRTVVIEASTGFLGTSSKLIAVPWEKTRFDATRKRLRLTDTRDALKALPEFAYGGAETALIGKDGRRDAAGKSG